MKLKINWLCFFILSLLLLNIVYANEGFVGNFIKDKLSIINDAKYLEEELQEFYDRRNIKVVLYTSEESVNDKEILMRYGLDKLSENDNFNVLIVYDKVNGLRDYISKCAEKYSDLFDRKKQMLDIFGALQ